MTNQTELNPGFWKEPVGHCTNPQCGLVYDTEKGWGYGPRCRHCGNNVANAITPEGKVVAFRRKGK